MAHIFPCVVHPQVENTDDIKPLDVYVGCILWEKTHFHGKYPIYCCTSYVTLAIGHTMFHMQSSSLLCSPQLLNNTFLLLTVLWEIPCFIFKFQVSKFIALAQPLQEGVNVHVYVQKIKKQENVN